MDETAIWKEATKYLWTVVAGVGAWLYNKQESRIKALEDNMQTKSAARERKEEVDKFLEDRRLGEIALHAKIESRSEKLDDKIDSLTKSMHSEFSEIKTILLGMVK